MAQYSQDVTASLTSASSRILQIRTPARRIGFTIRNTSAAAVVSLSKGNSGAVAGQGIVLNPNDAYSESTNEGFFCWQGEVQAVTNGAGGSVSISEMFEA